ncbi:MAG TPA: hypothetical protein VJU17_11675 [Gemmatimonadales bacterium]|nr:hypothetical protein [Gemmatimonadales bacterium]
MFLGHYGVALALKRAEPKLSLGTLFLAVQLCDLLWGAFLLLGWEHVRIVTDGSSVIPFEFYDYPISHSLVGTLIWSVVAAALYYSWPTRDTSRHWQAAALVGLAVFSHFVLDVLVHLPDLPLSGNDSPKLGLGLWNHPLIVLVMELLSLAVGLTVYVALRSQRYPVRPVRLSLLVLVLLVTYFASQYGPLPPNVTSVALGDILFLLAVAALAGWADRRATPAELEHR